MHAIDGTAVVDMNCVLETPLRVKEACAVFL